MRSHSRMRFPRLGLSSYLCFCCAFSTQNESFCYFPWVSRTSFCQEKRKSRILNVCLGPVLCTSHQMLAQQAACPPPPPSCPPRRSWQTAPALLLVWCRAAPALLQEPLPATAESRAMPRSQLRSSHGQRPAGFCGLKRWQGWEQSLLSSVIADSSQIFCLEPFCLSHQKSTQIFLFPPSHSLASWLLRLCRVPAVSLLVAFCIFLFLLSPVSCAVGGICKLSRMSFICKLYW